jgi:hypothetical protein
MEDGQRITVSILYSLSSILVCSMMAAILIMAHYAEAATLSSTLSITLSFIPNALSEGQSGPLRLMRIAAMLGALLFSA